MINIYLKTAWRNLVKNKVYAFINIVGLSVGIAVTTLIGLWIWDELSFDKYHQNYDHIAQVQQHVTNNGEVQTWSAVPFPLAAELRKNYGSDFKYIVMAAGTGHHLLSLNDKKLTTYGTYFEPQAPDMLTLKMLKGSRSALKDPASILLSASTAKAYFGDTDPMQQAMKIDNQLNVKVAGVYEDLPKNSTFTEIKFIAPWDLYFNNTEWIRTADDPWRPNAFMLFAQLAEHTDITQVSAKIKDVKLRNVNAQLAKKKPALFLHPMSKWHLYSDFKNGVNAGGRIQYVWLFGIIGVFVLILACINFMNLSTARSEKRAREVGIRKAIGSLRRQLIYQFFCESLLCVALAFVLSLALVQLSLHFFNDLADKKMEIPWNNLWFWILSLGFSLVTGLIAGSYPALYLSSFQPVKVLKGSFKVGKLAAIPRRILVVLQFTVSVTLIIGTIIIFRQVQFAKDRPLGYNNNNLLNVYMVTDKIHTHFDVIKEQLLKAGAIVSMAEAGSPPSEIYSTSSGFDWKDKDPNLSVDFPNTGVSYDYGKTIGWQFTDGRDFSTTLKTDSSALIVNETAVKFMGLKNPLGETIKWFDSSYKIIGIIKDMVAQSPYEQARPSFFYLSKDPGGVVLLKLNPKSGGSESMAKIKAVFQKINPEQPFDYQFVDEQYARKFGNEERVGKLAGCFAGLAIFISCLGLFGMASFMAEQRIKEIGIRKVLGASVFNMWQLLSKDFIVMVFISFVIASPIAYYFMDNWLQNYYYRSGITAWVFIITAVAALLITMLTVSYQAIKAATANPMKNLKTE